MSENKYPALSDALTNFHEDSGYLLRKLQVGQMDEKRFKNLINSEIKNLKDKIAEELK